MESLYQYVMTQLDRTKQTYAEVAEGSGVPKRTLEKIARRETENPGIQHVESLASYFKSLRRRPKNSQVAA